MPGLCQPSHSSCRSIVRPFHLRPYHSISYSVDYSPKLFNCCCVRGWPILFRVSRFAPQSRRAVSAWIRAIHISFCDKSPSSSILQLLQPFPFVLVLFSELFVCPSFICLGLSEDRLCSFFSFCGGVSFFTFFFLSFLLSRTPIEKSGKRKDSRGEI